MNLLESWPIPSEQEDERIFLDKEAFALFHLFHIFEPVIKDLRLNELFLLLARG